MRILLVDDEIEFISTLADRLAMRGISADYATSGRQALEKVHQTHYDLALLDMKMAGLGGFETMDQIRKDCPTMKFIILTGHGDEEAYLKSKEIGVAFYLMKPLDIELLIEKINEALKNG